jgi:hypothetical protein
MWAPHKIQEIGKGCPCTTSTPFKAVNIDWCMPWAHEPERGCLGPATAHMQCCAWRCCAWRMGRMGACGSPRLVSKSTAAVLAAHHIYIGACCAKSWAPDTPRHSDHFGCHVCWGAAAQTTPNATSMARSWSLVRHTAPVWSLEVRRRLNRGLPSRWRVIGRVPFLDTYAHARPRTQLPPCPAPSRRRYRCPSATHDAGAAEMAYGRRTFEISVFTGRTFRQAAFRTTHSTRRTLHLRTPRAVLRDRVSTLYPWY